MQTLAETLHALLAKNIVHFTFLKVDGSIRHAVGTRNLGIASATLGYDIPTPKGEEQPNSYYDLEKGGWRSYKPSNIISIDSFEQPKPTLPKREIPIQPRSFGGGEMPADLDLNRFVRLLFGGGGMGETEIPTAPRYVDWLAERIATAKENLKEVMEILDEISSYLAK